MDTIHIVLLVLFLNIVLTKVVLLNYRSKKIETNKVSFELTNNTIYHMTKNDAIKNLNPKLYEFIYGSEIFEAYCEVIIIYNVDNIYNNTCIYKVITTDNYEYAKLYAKEKCSQQKIFENGHHDKINNECYTINPNKELFEHNYIGHIKLLLKITTYLYVIITGVLIISNLLKQSNINCSEFIFGPKNNKDIESQEDQINQENSKTNVHVEINSNVDVTKKTDNLQLLMLILFQNQV